MTNAFDVVEGSFTVLANAKGQHSLRPEFADIPAGWQVVFGPADRDTCLGYATAHRSDQSRRVVETADDRSECIPLSYNQKFLLAFDKGDADGAFGERHTLVDGWRLTGPVDLAALRGALDDVVARHEVLRTSLVSDANGGQQNIHPPSPVRLTVRDLNDADPANRHWLTEELLNEIDAEPISVRELPHLRAVLGRFDVADSVLILACHHTATDGWSMGIILRDLAACYTARQFNRPADLSTALQYREFAAWQQSTTVTGKSVDYWREKLSGANMLAIPTDRPWPTDKPDRYAAHRFVIEAEVAAAMAAYARSMRSSPFMVLLAAYTTQLREMTGVADVVTPTFTAGRYQDRFAHTVGPFFNLLPLRTNLVGCRHFRDVLERTRTTCIQAYSHDIPFAAIVGETPEITAAFGDPGGAVAAFEMLQHPSFADDPRFGDTACTPVRERRLSQLVSSGIPNGALWALDVLPSGGIGGSLKYNRNTFDDDTIAGIVADFQRVLGTVLTSPDSPLSSL